jgi:hypothetical protein
MNASGSLGLRWIRSSLAVVILLVSFEASAAGAATLAGCPVFPANNIWNTPIDTLPVHQRSGAYIASIGLATTLHPDFGSGTWDGGPIGIPFTTVPGNQTKVGISFDYSSESDPGPYPIPPNVPIEGGSASDGDRHILILDRDHCVLYEAYYAFPQQNGAWHAGSGAVFDLNSHALRPSGWTSADAAGLPILPGLVRYDEVAAGEIQHAIRFTASHTQKAFLWPARHLASSDTNPDRPPMGLRVRLKANFNVSGFSPQVQVILRAMKKYGLILADNGSDWYLSGAPDERWDNDMLRELQQISGANFEAVDVSSLMIDPNSGEARGTNRCDLDGSGATNVVDVQLGVNQALGSSSCGAGDVDGNGVCNVVDVQLLVNSALGGQCGVGD